MSDGVASRGPWTGRVLFALGNVVLIVLSVSLAFALNEWRDTREDAALVEQALLGFVQEIEGNRERISDALAHHRDIVGPIGEGETESLQLRTAFLTDTAWESAQASGALAHMDYATVAALAEVHAMQQIYIELGTGLIQMIYFGNIFGSDELPTDIRGYAPALHDLIFFEGILMDRYDAALALLSSDDAAERTDMGEQAEDDA